LLKETTRGIARSRTAPGQGGGKKVQTLQTGGPRGRGVGKEDAAAGFHSLYRKGRKRGGEMVRGAFKKGLGLKVLKKYREVLTMEN